MNNKQALINVAEWLEKGAPHVTVGKHSIAAFDMDVAVEGGNCGTACCIAGAIVQFENLVSPVTNRADFFSGDEYTEDGVGELAAEHIGLVHEDALKLFEPWSHFEYENTSEFSDPARAAKVVRHFLKTEEVNWDLFPVSPVYMESAGSRNYAND